MSNVTAVKEAQAAELAAEAKARQTIANCMEQANDKVSEAVRVKSETIRIANARIKAHRKKEQIAWGSLLATLICCLIAYPAFLEDAWTFVYAPLSWLWNNLSIPVMTLSIACTAALGYGTLRLWQYYRKCWCELLLIILLGSLAFIIVFGESIRSFLGINLVLIFAVIQIVSAVTLDFIRTPVSR